MERHSSKRKHHGQPHQSNANRESERHRPSGTENGAYGDSKRRSVHHELRKETLAKPPLSRDDDYVQRWLAQNDKEIEMDTNRPGTQEKKTERHDTKRKPQLELRAFRNAFYETDDAQRKLHPEQKRRNRSSSDSSLLEPVVKAEPKSRKGEPKSALERREEPVSRHQKKRNVESLDSASSADSHVYHKTFLKRERHKTREDRYEPKKKKHKEDTQDGEPKRKKKREKKGDMKKAAKKAGEDLMNNFSSKSVAQDRLTIRPHGPGLFKNGRASSPARRRGLPDLVFSEMEFLQHPPRYPDAQNTSKTREKEKRRASREQQEISMFFRATKTPLAETSPKARTEESSTYMSGERSMYIKQGALDRTQDRSKVIDLSEKPYLGFGQPSPSSDRFSASRGRSPSSHQLRNLPETTSRLSENATTAVTWSEIQVSPGATAASRRQIHHYQHHASPTPETIRRSIEDTGIFRDTGIERTSRLTSSRRKPTQSQDGLYEKQHLKDVQETLDRSDRTIKSATSQSRIASRYSMPSAKDQQSESRDQSPRQQRNSSTEKRAAAEILSGKENEKRPIGMNDPATRQVGQVIAEHYDPSIGWHRQQDLDRVEKSSAAPPLDVESLRESKSTPMTREQIVKNARVKRPATTIPVETVSEEQSLHNGKNALPSQQAVSGENAGNGGRINTAPIEYVLQPASVNASGTAVRGESLYQPSLENFKVMNRGNDAHESYKIENNLTRRDFQPTFSPPQFGRWLVGLSRERMAFPISRNDSPRLGSTELDTASIAGLPARGPSRSSFGQAPPRRPRLPTDVEPAPLYLNQIRRQFLPEQSILESDICNYRPEDSYGEFTPEMVPYLEENGYDMLEEQDYEAGGFAEYSIGEDEEELEYYAEHDTNEPQAWQSIAPNDMVEHHEPWNGLEADMSNDHEVVEGSYNDQGFAESYGVEEHGIVYEDQLTEGLLIQGFWRPNRPF